VFEIEGITQAGTFLFWSCWIVAIPMSFVYLYRLSIGYYKGIGDRDWEDQYW